MLIAAPFRTSLTQGAVLVYPRQEGVFSAEEKSLISVVTGFAAVAIANAELYNTARARAYELHQLLDISAELGSIGQLDEFLQQFALRAADFLGFGRGFIGLLENGAFHVRWAAENGQTKQVDFLLPAGPASRALLKKEVFWSDEPSKVPGAKSGNPEQVRCAAIVDRPSARYRGRSPGNVRCAGPARSGRHLAGGDSPRPRSGGASCRRAGGDSQPPSIRAASPPGRVADGTGPRTQRPPKASRLCPALCWPGRRHPGRTSSGARGQTRERHGNPGHTGRRRPRN